MFYIPLLRDYLYISFCQLLVYTQLSSCIDIYLVDYCIQDCIPHFCFLYSLIIKSTKYVEIEQEICSSNEIYLMIKIKGTNN